MVRILIIEDNKEKLEKIKSVIEGECQPNTFSLTSLNSVKDGKRALFYDQYDLLILDLVLPIEEGQAPEEKNGISFLQDIYDHPQFKKPIHVAGLTEFSDLKLQYESLFHKQLNHLINYEPDSHNWRDQLKHIVWRLIEKESEFYKLRSAEYDYDVAFISATEKEFVEIKKLSQNWEIINVANDSTEYKATEFSGREGKKIKVVGADALEMGLVATTALSTKVIENFRPRYLIMTGIAACVQDQETHGYGDILIADETWDGGAGKISQSSTNKPVFKPEARHLRLDADVREKIKSLATPSTLRTIRDKWGYAKPNTELSIHFGSIASVAGVIENDAVVGTLKGKDRKLLGLEMESYGLFYASVHCKNPKPISIAIKSISDFGVPGKSDEYQPYASYTSAQFAFKLITEKLF